MTERVELEPKTVEAIEYLLAYLISDKTGYRDMNEYTYVTCFNLEYARKQLKDYLSVPSKRVGAIIVRKTTTTINPAYPIVRMISIVEAIVETKANWQE